MQFKLKHTILIVGCFFYAGTFLIGQNIISNGDFEQNTSGWDTYFGSGYAGTLTQNTISHSGSYSARINVTQVPSTPLVRNAQLKTTDFHIQAGHDYHLSMW
ncbi:MAG: carbohydrate binding domain-containing protein, partial [Bacteroidota bacterium]|nr:carbohydrate binding domain-containing protein [Bacteroidota bacterium]